MKMSHRILQVLALGTIATAPLYAQGAAMQHDDPDKAVAGGGTLPAGWAARTDKDAALANVKFTKMGEGWHVTLGPAVVLYRDADKATGNYHATVTLSQTKAPMHPEGYGLVVGGSALSAAGQKYTYFLVRGDGKFLIKRRNGPDAAGNPSNVTSGWTDNAAINKADADGKATNELAVGVSNGKVSFTVNGKEVYSTEASKVDTDGIVGIRVNHNLDIHVAKMAIHKL